MAIVVRAAVLFLGGTLLPDIVCLIAVEECQFFYVNVARLGQARRQLRLADSSLVSKILTGPGYAFNAVVSLEVILDFGCGPRFTDLTQIVNDRGKQLWCVFAQITVEGGEGSLHVLN